MKELLFGLWFAILAYVSAIGVYWLGIGQPFSEDYGTAMFFLLVSPIVALFLKETVK